MATLIKVDRNGTKYYEGYVTCDRCDGKGVYYIGVCNGKPVPSHVDQGICFKCGGSGKVMGKWKEYTEEYAAKLKERREKKAEQMRKKYEQEQKEREEKRIKEEEERRAEEERKAAEEKAEKEKSHFIGVVGDKISSKAIYMFSAWYECKSFAGFGTETRYIHNFKIGDDTVVWKTSNGLGDIEKGEEITLKGTIKEHSEYNGERQTILTRCKVAKE